MEEVLTREHVELPRHQSEPTLPALVAHLHRDESVCEVVDVLLDRFCRRGSFVHFGSQFLNLGRVVFERVANLGFEVIDDHKVWEEGQNVFDFDQIRSLEELHRTASHQGTECLEGREYSPFDVLLLLHHVFGYLQPQLLSE